MVQNTLKKIDQFYTGANRWWLPALCGLLYSLALPPFNSFWHPLFTLFPLLSFFALVPLLFFVTRKPLRRALFHTAIYLFFMSLGQYYWIGFVTAEGLWVLVLIGTFLICIAVGLFYFVAALSFRILRTTLPRGCLYIFPAVWVLVDYSRTLSDISFPWALIGYSSAGFLPLAQLSSITGVWGLTFIIVMGNALVYDLLVAVKNGSAQVSQNKVRAGILAAFVVVVSVWGILRISGTDLSSADTARVTKLQSYMDQFNWNRSSLDTAFTVTDSMLSVVEPQRPDLIILPESALLCYLDRVPDHRRTVQSWAARASVPIIIGALHWDYPPEDSPHKYHVYNSAFLIRPDSTDLKPYHKKMLVPFSEAMPFEAQFPILSRVNLGSAGFRRGAGETVFAVNKKIRVSPNICYEIIYPEFVQKRLDSSINLLVNVTNDGWFGRSSGPYQHAAMAQIRSVENGISLARSANSGISMSVDPLGRVLSRTGLYERVILTQDIPLIRLSTFYSRHGDWFVTLSMVMVIFGGVVVVRRRVSRGWRTQKKPPK